MLVHIKEIIKKKNKTDFSQHSCTNVFTAVADLQVHIRYFKSTVFIFILNRCYDIYFLCYMTINSNQNHVTFVYIEFLLGYLNIDCEFEVQKKL